MADRVTRVSAGRLAQTAGRLAADELAALDDALMVVLGLA
jgi:mRNA-degrading endonuclease toxin of MazEF toxin-antitoxin module